MSPRPFFVSRHAQGDGSHERSPAPTDPPDLRPGERDSLSDAPATAIRGREADEAEREQRQ